ncbi:MAG: SDR family oxidoreductase [Myxococcales bacterium]
MILVTAATGHLGRLVVDQLLAKVSATQVVAAVRNLDKAKDLAARGVQVRKADYEQPSTLEAAFRGATKLLLISASEIGRRVAQHENAVAAARKAGIPLLVYTSILRADRSGISLADEHLATERAIRGSGVPFIFLRNGWYIENYTENLGPALQHGVIMGAADDGRIAAATRADYAAAAVAVLTARSEPGKVYELAGDQPFTMAELAAEVSRQSGKTVVYRNLPPDEYEKALLGLGLPEPVARMLRSADEGIARGDLDDRTGELRRLIGRPTTPLAQAVAAALNR